MSSPILIFIILSCFNQNIYTRPIEDNKDGASHKNYTLIIFFIIAALFIFACILYYTKQLWYDALRCCFSKKKSITSSDLDMDISDQIYKDIDFESIHFTEVAGYSRLSIDIADLMGKYLDNNKEDDLKSYYIEASSLSQSNISKLDSRTLLKLNNVYLSPNAEDYNVFEDESSNMKSQEITDIKIEQGNTSFIDNSLSLFNDKSSSIPERILVDISGIDFKSSENKNSNIEEKSKESQKNENNGEKGIEESENTDNSAKNSSIKISNEKILVNKNLKLLSLSDEISSVEKVEIPFQDEKELSDEILEISSSKNSIEDGKVDVTKKISKVTKDISEETNENIPSLVVESTEQQRSFIIKSNSGNAGNTKKVKVKLSPTIINDESISSLDIGEGHTLEELNENEEIVDVETNDTVESLEKVSESNNNNLNLIEPERKIQDDSFVILDNEKSEDYNELSISDIEEKENQSEIDEIDEIETTNEKVETPVESINTETKIEVITETESSIEVPIESVVESKAEEAAETEPIVEPVNSETKVEDVTEIEPPVELQVESINAKTKDKEIEEIESVVESIKTETKVEEIAEIDIITEPPVELPVNVEIKVEEIQETESVVEPINAETKVEETAETEPIVEPVNAETKVEEIAENETVIGQEIVDVKVDEINEPFIKQEQNNVLNNENNENIVELTAEPVQIIESNKESIEEYEVEKRSTNVNHDKEDKEEKIKKIEENLQAIQQSMEVDITDVSPSSKKSENKIITNHPSIKKRSSSLNIKKRRESIINNKNNSSNKKNKSLSQKGKKIQQSIDEEIQSISNEMNNDTIKEKFNDYVERRSSIQSDTNSSTYSSKRASALSAFILQNENSFDEFDSSLPSKSVNSPNVDTSMNEDHTQDKLNAMTSITSSIPPSQLHDQLRSPTPPGYYRRYGCISPSPSLESSVDSLRDRCISPTPSEESTFSNSSHSFSIGKISRNKQFEVVYDHKPQLPDEIPLKKGDKVLIKQVFEDGWAYGIVKNKHLDGIFPIQCLGEEIEPDRNGRMVPRLVRVYQARLEDEEQKKQEEEEFKKMITDQARKNVLFKLALSHPK